MALRGRRHPGPLVAQIGHRLETPVALAYENRSLHGEDGTEYSASASRPGMCGMPLPHVKIARREALQIVHGRHAYELVFEVHPMRHGREHVHRETGQFPAFLKTIGIVVDGGADGQRARRRRRFSGVSGRCQTQAAKKNAS
jgi:hypothetical protein